MGQFHFDVPEKLLACFGPDRSLWRWAYLSGIEGLPWEGRVSQSDGRLTISRAVDDSGKLSMPWHIEGYGPVTLTTCSLRPGHQAYLLPLELARGSCYRVRSQAEVWQRAGLRLSPSFEDLLRGGTAAFLDAAQRQTDPDASGERAVQAIRQLEAAAADLMESYAAQALAYHKQSSGRLGTLTAATLIPTAAPTPAQEALYLRSFNSAALRISWSEVETDAGRLDFDATDQLLAWCHKHALRVIAGPLFDFQDKLLPHWLYLLEDNFDALLEAVTRFAEQAVRRYAGRVQLWNAVAGMNTAGPIRLSEDQVMRLTLAVVQVVRRTDSRTPVIVSFDQPWGEYLSQQRDGISPLHCADALVRSGVGIAGVGLEIRMNYQGIGTLPRTVLDFSQQIDRWSVLGLPLLCQLAVPAASGADAAALRPAEIFPPGGNGHVTGDDQLRLAGGFIRSLLAKSFVHGIVWEGWDDSRQHTLPHAGLLDSRGAPRPLHEYLCRVRRDFLC